MVVKIEEAVVILFAGGYSKFTSLEIFSFIIIATTATSYLLKHYASFFAGVGSGWHEEFSQDL